MIECVIIGVISLYIILILQLIEALMKQRMNLKRNKKMYQCNKCKDTGIIKPEKKVKVNLFKTVIISFMGMFMATKIPTGKGVGRVVETQRCDCAEGKKLKH